MRWNRSTVTLTHACTPHIYLSTFWSYFFFHWKLKCSIKRLSPFNSPYSGIPNSKCVACPILVSQFYINGENPFHTLNLIIMWKVSASKISLFFLHILKNIFNGLIYSLYQLHSLYCFLSTIFSLINPRLL